MSDQAPFPEVNVAVTLVVLNDRILGVYNEKWGAFTLPMTKRREWADPEVPAATRYEDWADAAARAAAEVLGVTSAGALESLHEAVGLTTLEYQQGDRDGIWKRYHFEVFRLPLGLRPLVIPGTLAEWLALDEWLDPARRPISKTARYLITAARDDAQLNVWPFP